MLAVYPVIFLLSAQHQQLNSLWEKISVLHLTSAVPMAIKPCVLMLSGLVGERRDSLRPGMGLFRLKFNYSWKANAAFLTVTFSETLNMHIKA